MVAMLLRAAGLVCSVVAMTPSSASVPSSTEQVRGLRAKLGKVTQKGALPQSLLTEAGKVEDDADSALNVAALFHGDGADSVMQGVLDEYKTFTADLLKFMARLKSDPKAAAAELAPAQSADTDARAKGLLPELSLQVENALARMQAAKDLSPDEEASRAAIVPQLKTALSTNDSEDIVIRITALNDALSAAHEFMAERVEALGRQQAQLGAEIQEGEAKMLYNMLKQRRQLPMKAQMAILKRHQFVNSTYAQQLMKSHGAQKPLYSQLEALLPSGVLEKIAPKPKTAGHLEVAGSDGRVQIVSSRMKNMVQLMVKELTGVRTKLQGMLGSPKTTAVEREQAKVIVAGLDEALGKVTKTNDLKSQLDILDDVEKHVAIWSAAASAPAKTAI